LIVIGVILFACFNAVIFMPHMSMVSSKAVNVNLKPTFRKNNASPSPCSPPDAPPHAVPKNKKLPLTVYVVSLSGVSGAHDSNHMRLNNFTHSWREKCGPEIILKVCPGVISKRRGYGLTKGFVNCFEQAMNDKQDYYVFFEDDARLKTSEFCNASYRDFIWETVDREKVLLILLGGHTVKINPFFNKTGLTTEAMSSYGSYGFMLGHKNLKNLHDHYVENLSAPNQEPLSPDISWYNLARRLKKKILIMSPTIILHIAGYSNTWNKMRINDIS
jgi:hypothetical protein